MTEAWQYALLGIGAGSVYALLGVGIVLIFRGSGVINFAHGAFAMLGAFLFLTLHSDHGWATAPAILVSVAGVSLVGLATDQAVMRPLRRASTLARLIATLGVLLIIQSVATLIWGGNPIVVLPLIQPHPVDVFGATVTSDRIWLLLIALVVTGVLMAIWRFTRAGWLIEAASENQVGTASLGWSPEVVSSTMWTVGAALAGLAGILIAPITQLSITNLTLTVIVALAAGLLGGFRSFPLTLVGGLGIGIAQSLLTNYSNITGGADAVPLILIVIIMMVGGSALPLRGYVADRMPQVGRGRIRPVIVGPAFLIAVGAFSLITSTDWLTALGSTLAVSIILMSLVVLMGYTGQISLAQYALAGVGALVAARLIAESGWPFEIAALVGIVAAMAAGLAFAIPALRTRGVSLTVVTLALGTAIQSVVFNSDSLSGGSSGVSLSSLKVFGLSVTPLDHPGRYAILILVCFTICAILVANLRRGATGRRLLAIRESERAAAACGLSVMRVKMYAFAVGGALAGLGGILLAFEQSSIVFFTGFDPMTSVTATLQTVIGGVGYVVGTVAGAPLAPSSIGSILSKGGGGISSYLPLIGGALAIITLLQHQAGFANTVERLTRRWVRHGQIAPPAAQQRHRVAPKTLVVKDLNVSYGGVRAVSHLSLEVRPGEVIGLIGPNGAGKTSFMDAVTGFAAATGEVSLDGARLERLPPHRRARAGLARSFQTLEIFAGMTVLENIQVASERNERWRFLLDPIRPIQRPLTPAAAAAVAEFKLAEFLDRSPDELSHGRLRLVGIARSVAMEPSILLLDEPASGLDDEESRELAELVRRLADDWGMGILVIEHDMDFVMSISDQIVVMDFGAEIARGTQEEVSTHPAAVAAYLGRAEPESDEDHVVWQDVPASAGMTSNEGLS